ncbi:MAG TPA: TlyA family RNA methyltransferase [Blastocatellia bacterium]|jgi:23S rRNA (cytidine1920-2'-O)/16S rRNA (cytidine1409-2'-O)-methyltransferase
MRKERLDKIVLDRGLAESRTRAQAMILAGVVLVGDQRADKPGQMVDSSAEIRIKGETPRYVSRGGLKLEAALGEFGVSPDGMTCVDVGASTGGFTDCLLQHGASRVWAIDVGHNQLSWRIRQDPRVVVLEGQNARQLDPEQFPVRFDLATVDVIFISLTKVLPAIVPCLKESAECIALIKPQFEVGKGEVGRSGVVTDPKKHRRVLIEVLRSAAAMGLAAINLIESPILGAEGNREFLAHLKLRACDQAKLAAIDDRIAALTAE